MQDDKGNDSALDQQINRIQEFNRELVPAKPKQVLSDFRMGDAGIIMMLVEDLKVLPDFNVRIPTPEHAEHIRRLADLIKINGYDKSKPIAAIGAMEGGKRVVYVTDGHNRLAAVKIAIQEGADIEDLPVALQPAGVSMEDLTVGLLTLNDGKKLTALETAFVCKRLSGFGWDPEKIAGRIGYTTKYVEMLLRVAGAPAELREMVKSDTIAAHNAILAMDTFGENVVEEVKKLANGKSPRPGGKVGKATPPRVTVKDIKPNIKPVVMQELQAAVIELHKSTDAMALVQAKAAGQTTIAIDYAVAVKLLKLAEQIGDSIPKFKLKNSVLFPTDKSAPDASKALQELISA